MENVVSLNDPVVTETEEPKGGSAGGFFKGLGNVFFVILLCIFNLLLFAAAFVKDFASEYSIPDIGGISGAGLTKFLSSVYPLILFGGLIVIIALLVILVNKKKAQNIFLVFFISLLITGVISIALSLLTNLIVKGMGSELRDMIIQGVPAFKELTMLFGIAMIVLASVMFFVYALIKIFKGGKKQ